MIRGALCYLSVLGIAQCCRQAVAQPVLRWEIEATIIEFRDSHMLLPNVRLGDPVRGFLSYNLATPPDEPDPNEVSYIHDTGFAVGGMVIENPRNDTEISFAPYYCGDCSIVTVSNDVNDEFLMTEAGSVGVIQSVFAPGGPAGDEAFLVLGLIGSPNVLADTTLPTSFNVNDWTDSALTFVVDLDPESATYVFASIHSITPVEPPKVPGDFNASGIVDTADYVAWRDGLGTTTTQTDYDTWRAEFRKHDPPVTHLPLTPGATLQWARQPGTAAADSAQAGVAAGGEGSVYISGGTDGSLGGPNAGAQDAFLAKYDAAGGLVWTRQLGTNKADSSRDLAIDRQGNLFISGNTSGSLGSPLTGTNDAFVAKYDDTGTFLWARQLGVKDKSTSSSGVSTDGLGNVYISGTTLGILDASGTDALGGNDAFVAKYSSDGSHLWTRQIGSTGNEFGTMVSADGLGNVYLAGRTNGSLGGLNEPGDFDAWLAKYTADGNRQWIRQLGTTELDNAFGVAADGLGNVYFTGSTQGELSGPNAGESDAYLAKYDAAGNLLWVRQLGSSFRDTGQDVSVDALGNAYIVGSTGESEGADAYAAKYDAAGNLLWTHQFGTIASDSGTGISADGQGNVHILGNTSGNFGGPNAGGTDVFLAKFLDGLPGQPSAATLHPAVPEPNTIALLIAACHCWLALQCRTRLRPPRHLTPDTKKNRPVRPRGKRNPHRPDCKPQRSRCAPGA
jgi:hypothetical protein